MNCEACRSQLTAYAEGVVERASTEAVERHLGSCPACAAELAELRDLMEILIRDRDAVPAPSLTAEVMDRIVQEQDRKLRRLQMRRHIRLIGWSGTAVAALVVAAVVLTWPGRVDNRAEAAAVLAKAVAAAKEIRSVRLECRMRTLPRDNFSFIAPDQDFVPMTVWRTFGESPKWRVEKPGRVAVMDGASTVMLIKPNIAARAPAGPAFDVGWVLDFADPHDVVAEGLQSALAERAELKLGEGSTADGKRLLVVTARVKAQVPEKGYLKNKFVLTADTRRVFRFGADDQRLVGLDVFLVADDGTEPLIFQVTRVDYDHPIDPAVFQLDLPDDVVWHESPKPLAGGERYAQMTPREAARAFFEACAREDWDEAGKFLPVPFTAQIKAILGGLELIELGEPFESESTGAHFVPYVIKLKQGQVVKKNLGLKKPREANRFLIDGGL